MNGPAFLRGSSEARRALVSRAVPCRVNRYDPAWYAPRGTDARKEKASQECVGRPMKEGDTWRLCASHTPAGEMSSPVVAVFRERLSPKRYVESWRL